MEGLWSDLCSEDQHHSTSSSLGKFCTSPRVEIVGLVLSLQGRKKKKKGKNKSSVKKALLGFCKRANRCVVL